MFITEFFPYQLGENPPTTNNGDLETKGWEASLKWRNQVSKDFEYSISAFVSDAKDEIIDRGGFVEPTSGVSTAVEGYPISSLWVYETDGIFQNQEEVNAYYNTYDVILNDAGEPMESTGVATTLSRGDIRKVDVNEDGRIDQTDLVYAGDVRPHYNFAINLGAKYKGFDLSALFQGVGNQNILRTFLELLHIQLDLVGTGQLMILEYKIIDTYV